MAKIWFVPHANRVATYCKLISFVSMWQLQNAPIVHGCKAFCLWITAPEMYLKVLQKGNMYHCLEIFGNRSIETIYPMHVSLGSFTAATLEVHPLLIGRLLSLGRRDHCFPQKSWKRQSAALVEDLWYVKCEILSKVTWQGTLTTR